MQETATSKEDSFTNSRKQSIFFKEYVPKDVKSMVFFFHGIGEHSQRYVHVFDAMMKANIAVYAMDLHGHGKSDGERVYCQKFDDYIDDANQFVTLIRERTQLKVKHFIMGMSFGGLISCHSVLSAKHHWDGMILAAPAIGVPLTCVLKVQKLFASILSKLVPHAAIVPAIRTEDLSRDPNVIQDYISDPLVVVGPLKARLGAETLKAFKLLDTRAKEINVPMLISQGTADTITSFPAAKAFYEKVSSKDKMLQELEGLYHCIFHEKEKDKVIEDIVKWISTKTIDAEDAATI